MIDFLNSRKIEKAKLNSLSAAEKIRESEKGEYANQRIESIINNKFKEMGIQERMTEMNLLMEDVAKKMEDMMILQQSNCRPKISNSVRKVKIKEMIGILLKQHGKLSAPQLCNFLNLSRTRCSEYLKEMEMTGALESELNCRKRFYRIRQKK